MLAGYFVDLYQKRNGDAGADRSNYCNADLRADESSNSSEVITSLEDEVPETSAGLGPGSIIPLFSRSIRLPRPMELNRL